MTAPVSDARPAWEAVADHLEHLTSSPTADQRQTAALLSVDIPSDIPAPVAAVVLRSQLSASLLETLPRADGIPEVLGEIEEELGLERTCDLLTGTRAEVSAWFAARYMLKTVRGLRELRPLPGDVVSSAGWAASERRVISSIRGDGRVIMKRHPPRSAWPNHLMIVERVGSGGYLAAVEDIDARIRNATVSTSTNMANFARLDEYALSSHVPTPEAIRALEELLASGQSLEEPLQRVLTQYPELLATTVVGGWKTFVVPKPRLGAEHVPDFLVLGINSVGPQWVTIEIEGSRHKILNRDDSLSGQTRHAIRQINDWREWLTTNVAYAQTELGLYGITNLVPGLVIIGRDDPSAERRASRAQSDENARIAVHSWDWLLRSARNLGQNAPRASDFAVENLRRQHPPSPSMTPSSSGLDVSFDDLLAQFDDEELQGFGP